MTHTLVVLRHAKSSWEFAVADRDRPLSPRGKRDARAAGALLQAAGLHPDVALCSPASRARLTLEGALAGGLQAGAARIAPMLYESGPDEIVDELAATTEEVETLLIVSHLPTVEDVVELVCGPERKGPAWDAFHTKYPTSGMAVLELDGPWSGLRDHAARLVRFETPRG